MTRFDQAQASYRQAHLRNAPTQGFQGQLLLLMYEEAITACKIRNSQRAIQAIKALMLSLDRQFQPDLAAHMAYIYSNCITLLCKNDFEHTASILIDIRNTWRDVTLMQSAHHKKAS